MQPSIDFSFISAAIGDALGQMYAVSSMSVGDLSIRDLPDLMPRVDSGAIESIKTFVLIFSMLCAACIVWVLARMRGLSSQPNAVDELNPPEPAPAGPWMARWQEISRHMDSAKENDWKFAVIEADALIDRVLARSGFPGNTLGERLINIQPGQLAGLEGLWDAHKVRNIVAHQPDYFLRYSEAKSAIDKYEAILRELEAI